ncbi:methylenetetrahydrofolate reductase [Candidatus Neomarinimicrobiota bacterium]
MKVIEYIEKSSKTLFSYEIIPPKRGGKIEDVFSILEQLIKFEPPFIDLTSRSAEIYYEDIAQEMVKRHVKRKRPGTIGLSAAIKNRYNIETVPHLLCTGFSREETEDALIELNYLGINNVLAVRGDELRKNHIEKSGKTHNQFAADLVRQITDMNLGKYLEDLEDASATDFCIGVGGYPEKHFESPNLETDLKFLKKKVDAGADYLVTQMVFNNATYFNFVDNCRLIGINIPIIPGIKIISRKSHLRTIPKSFLVDIPKELSDQISEATDEDTQQIGIDWATQQCHELVKAGVPCIHFYIMNSAAEVADVVSKLR